MNQPLKHLRTAGGSRPYPPRVAHLLLWIAATMSALSMTAQSSPSLSEIRETLLEPLTLELSGGAFQTGRITRWDGSELRLEVSIGGGTAEMTFPASDIEGIQFPGGQFKTVLSDWKRIPERAQDVLSLYRSYYQQQGAYLDLLSQRDLGIFIDYAEFALQQNEPLKAVAIIDVITPHIEDESVQRQLEENLLLAFFNGGMREEAEEEARKWIKEAEPAGDSALGWRLLAELNFEQEDYESAFWTAMHPVAFSNQMQMAHLDVCYALALISAEELRLKDKPEQLAAEMRNRGIAWPDYVEILSGKAPDYFTLETAPDAGTKAEFQEDPSEIELEPIQTPSPIDPVESLPTRIYN